MRTFLATLLAAGAILSTPTLAESSSAKTAASSPLFGRWSVDVSRLPVPPEARPKDVTIAFGDAGDRKWTMRVEIVGPDGSKTDATGTYALDGSATPVHGTIEADTGAAKSPAPNVLVLALGKGGVPASTRIYTADANGKSMIETAVYFGHDGLPVLRTNYFNRVP
jgi:hypothetical protein